MSVINAVSSVSDRLVNKIVKKKKKILRKVATYFNTLNVRGLKFSISCLFFRADVVIIL